MVLTFNRSAWIIEFRRERLPRALTWALLAVIIALFAYNYFDNPLPGPYGACYTGRGGTRPCELPPSKNVAPDARTVARTLPVTKTP